MKWCSIQDINYWNIKCCSCFFLYKNKFTTSCLFRWIVDHIMVYIWCIEYIFGIIVTCQSLKIITFPVLWALKLLCVLQNRYFIHSTHVNICLVIRTENVFYEKLIFLRRSVIGYSKLHGWVKYTLVLRAIYSFWTSCNVGSLIVKVNIWLKYKKL